jgi:hypothetical protein
LLVRQIQLMAEKFYFHLRGWRGNRSYWQITSAWFSPLWAAITFFTHSIGQSSRTYLKKEKSMTSMAQQIENLRSNMMDILIQLLGSETARTLFSHVIRMILRRYSL